MDVAEKKFLIECLGSGYEILRQHGSPAEQGRFVRKPIDSLRSEPYRGFEEYLYSDNPDHFFLFLQATFVCSDATKIAQIIRRRDRNADAIRAIAAIELHSYEEGRFEEQLIEKVRHYSEMSDAQLKECFSRRFRIKHRDILTLPTEHSIFYAKVNHGYWEYVRGVYDREDFDRAKYRDVKPFRIKRLRTSGVSQAWAERLFRFLRPLEHGDARDGTYLNVSLTTGTESHVQSLRRELTPVTRGAAAGMLAMFETVSPNAEHFMLGDSGATRALIIKSRLRSFFERYVADAEACVFIVPPHLRQLGFVEFAGAVYKFLVPPSRINESWKAVLMSILGYLDRLALRHKSIVVLSQAGLIASIAPLLLSDLPRFQEVKIRFFDLGRVLDVAAPNVLRKQGWAEGNFDAYAAEGRKVFRDVEDDSFSIATMI
jgi:hypothetical protein